MSTRLLTRQAGAAPLLVAAMLVITGSGGLAAFAITTSAQLGLTAFPALAIAAAAFCLGIAGWFGAARYYVHWSAVSLTAALRFDAWSYLPLILLYLPTLRPEIPAWPFAIAAGLALGGKLVLYRHSGDLVARQQSGQTLRVDALRSIVALAVLAIGLLDLFTMDSFQIGTIAGNLAFMAAQPNADYVARMAEKGRGHYAGYFAFVRSVTPEDAVILIPPGVRPWYPESDSSLALAALWPRHVREATGFDLTAEDLAGVTHVLVTVVEGKPLDDAPSGFRWPRRFPAGAYMRYDNSPWGIVAVGRGQ